MTLVLTVTALCHRFCGRLHAAPDSEAVGVSRHRDQRMDGTRRDDHDARFKSRHLGEMLVVPGIPIRRFDQLRNAFRLTV